jgi:hypothetical protein
MFKEVIAVQFGNYMKLINTFCGQNLELLTVKVRSTYS